jgi:hypothetical protein
MESRLKNRLRQQRREEGRPVPVYITYDSFTTTRDEALEAAYQTGKIPANAAIVLLPEQCKNEEEWNRVVAEYEERKRQQQQQQQTAAGTDPAGSLYPKPQEDP